MSAPAQAAHPAPSDYPDTIDAAVLKVAGVVVLGAIMSILDITVVNVALPKLQTTFTGTDHPLAYSTVAWTVTAYTLALATVIPMTGWAADRFGTKRLYMLAITLFTAGSVLCASAGSINQLILFRVLQGLGGGLLMPLGMTIMTRAAGPKRMGRLMAILGIPMLLGPILGPILGGYLIDKVSWHWIFLINLPLGVLALAYAAWALPKDNPQPSESFDFLGMLMMSPGLAMFLYGVSSIPGEGTFFAPKVMGWGSAGLALLVAFVVYSFKPEHPLLDFRLFANRNLTVATVTMFIFGAAFFGGLLLVPTYFQQVRGEDALHAGLLVAPQGIGAMLTMPIAGALADKKPVGRIVPFGLIAIIIGMFLLSRVDGSTSYWGYIIPVLFLMGLGMGGTMMPIMTSAIKTLTAHQVARGSTLLNITQQIASSVGVAIMSVVLTNGLSNDKLIAQAGAFRIASEHVTDPAQMQKLLQDFPLVGSILAKYGTDQAAGAAALATQVREAMGTVFGHSFLVAAFLVLLTLVPAYFLPREHEESHLTDDESAPQVLIH
ncbi:MAG: DHA2 family efflux MFS transporter permease subunit [Tetrasphaera sp.]|jgi:EmrB/QacA subfamily drug resistance transporter|nr:DHA2 family efflux MFS transporter permease subunit [Tetrasphaera sp.]